MAADVIVPNMHQIICTHHTNLTQTVTSLTRALCNMIDMLHIMLKEHNTQHANHVTIDKGQEVETCQSFYKW